MNAYFLSLHPETPKRGYWDYALLEDLLEGFEKVEVNALPKEEAAVVVLPGRSHGDDIDAFNAEISKIQHAVIFIMGDEESVFPVEKIVHPSAEIWVQNPRPGRHDSYHKLGCGYTPHVRDFFPSVPEKRLKFFFAGQITHSRRQEMAEALRSHTDGSILIETEGFTQGIQPPAYCVGLSESKTAPCPSGPQTPDTFRLYEALELGSVPIADEQTPKEEWRGFWNWLFDETVPFPTYTRPSQMIATMNMAASVFPIDNNHVQAWWYRWKMRTKEKIRLQVGFDGNDLDPQDLITVIVPVSPIASHPDTSILEETIHNIRYHLPTSKIIITFDGVRLEQKHLQEQYEEHIRRILWLCRTWQNVEPMIFYEHSHQVAMARVALNRVITPLVLYVEQDTPLVIDEPIDWHRVTSALLLEEANVIRFHFEGHIPTEHRHLMIGEPEEDLQKTVQWSQRPHLARTDFYREMLKTHFSADANCFIEDRIHGKVQDDFNVDGLKGWQKWKLFIYHPNNTNIKRSYHTDGRHGEAKYDERQVW